MRRHLFLLLLFIMASGMLMAQDGAPADDWMEQLRAIAEDAGEEFDEKQLEALYTDLSYLAEHPIDLNTATQDDLRKLPFLTDAQVDSILSYRRRYQHFTTIYELKTIEALDWFTCRRIAPFVCVNRHGSERPAITLLICYTTA